MHPKRVVIARVSAIVAAVIARVSAIVAAVIARVSAIVAAVIAIVTTVVVAAAVWAFRSLLLGDLFPIIQIIVIPTSGCPRAWAMICLSPIVLRLGRHLLVIFPLHASDACRPLNRSRDLLLLDRVVRCDCSGGDMPSAMNAGGPLDLHG
jgi:hypothetical protein